jgi:anaerobic selenocysteine-containing dehydrogenase
MTREDGSPKFPGGYAEYLVRHERAPGIGPLAGWRGAGGESHGMGAPNPSQLQRYIENGCFWYHELAPDQRYFKHANASYLAYAKSVGFVGSTDPIVMQLYVEPLQKFRLAAEGHGPVQPPAHLRAQVERFFDPLPIWYAPFEHVGAESYPLSALTQRPMAMYHAWGSQNAWLRQIHGANRLYVGRSLAEREGIADDDWVWIESRLGRVKAQVRLMDGVNPDTVWTWNAIGKRSGTWGLAADAPESARGFLLNHLIGDMLADGTPNVDPVTGQAAWYDLRVRLARADGPPLSEPRFAEVRRPPGVPEPVPVLRHGARFKGRA